MHDHVLEPDLVGQLVLLAHALQGSDGIAGIPEKGHTAADLCLSLAISIQRDGHAPGLGEGQLLDFFLIFPIAVREDLDEQADRRAVRHQVGRVRTQQRFAAAEDDVDRPQPRAEVGEHFLPLFRCRRIFFALVFPNVAVDAAGVAELGEQDDDGSGTALRGEASAGECPQAVIDSVVQPFVNPAR